MEQTWYEVAAKSGRRATVLFAGDLGAGPLSAQLQGFIELLNRSSFRMALAATWPGKQLETPWVGGYYVPDVRVDRSSDCDPFRIAMIYSALPAPQAYEDSAQEYKRIMQMLLLNVLRMCLRQEHRELVLGAWGCDGQIGSGTAMRIAELFHDALFAFGSDVAYKFESVTFALPKRTLPVFQSRFNPCSIAA